VLLIAVAVIAVLAAAFTMGKKGVPAPAMPAVSDSSPVVTQKTTATPPPASSWKKYTFEGSDYLVALSFEYPSTWTVRRNLYRTPGDQAAGRPGQVETLAVYPDDNTNMAIIVGGRQAACGITIPGQAACFKNTPIYVIGGVTGSIFNHLVGSLR
jgi:hypothetical protein